MPKPYKSQKRGAGRHVQLSEYLQKTQAWATLKPGPRALYIELKRRYNGYNNGRIVLSHREAAVALAVTRNTVGPWFAALQERGFIAMTVGPYLGPSGVGRSALWSLQELATEDGEPATKGFLTWREPQKPCTKTGRSRHKKQDASSVVATKRGATVLKIVP